MVGSGYNTVIFSTETNIKTIDWRKKTERVSFDLSTGMFTDK